MPTDEIGVIEAIVGAELVADRSVGRRHSPCSSDSRSTSLAVSRCGKRLTERLRALPLQAGDVVVAAG